MKLLLFCLNTWSLTFLKFNVCQRYSLRPPLACILPLNMLGKRQPLLQLPPNRLCPHRGSGNSCPFSFSWTHPLWGTGPQLAQLTPGNTDFPSSSSLRLKKGEEWNFAVNKVCLIVQVVSQVTFWSCLQKNKWKAYQGVVTTFNLFSVFLWDSWWSGLMPMKHLLYNTLRRLKRYLDPSKFSSSFFGWHRWFFYVSDCFTLLEPNFILHKGTKWL